MKKLLIIAFIAISFSSQSQAIISKTITVDDNEKSGYYQTMDSSYIEISKIRKQWFSRNYNVWVKIGELKDGIKLDFYNTYKFVLDQDTNFMLAPLNRLKTWAKNQFNLTDSDIKLSYYPE